MCWRFRSEADNREPGNLAGVAITDFGPAGGPEPGILSNRSLLVAKGRVIASYRLCVCRDGQCPSARQVWGTPFRRRGIAAARGRGAGQASAKEGALGPPELARQLPPPPSDHRYVAIGGHIGLIDSKFQVKGVIHLHDNH